jgi:hypothetical protein
MSGGSSRLGTHDVLNFVLGGVMAVHYATDVWVVDTPFVYMPCWDYVLGVICSCGDRIHIHCSRRDWVWDDVPHRVGRDPNITKHCRMCHGVWMSQMAASADYFQYDRKMEGPRGHVRRLI